MKKILFAGLTFLLGISSSYGDVSITLPEDCQLKKIEYYYAPINQFVNAKTRMERGLVVDSVNVVDSKANIVLPKIQEAMMIGLDIDSHDLSLYGYPEEQINVNILSCNPFDYELTGTELASAMNNLHRISFPIANQFNELTPGQRQNQELMQSILNQYNQAQADFIKNSPDDIAAPIALLNLEGETFIALFDQYNNKMNNSILFPLIQKQYDREKKNIELEKKQKAMQEGNVQAPEFTLKDLDGKKVSLSDFRGKWVILDFWGSWCPWCIKGFPELKEAYEKYGDKLEIIGIDCRESEADWRAGVEKYQLPWINVYNPESSDLTSEYGVQGYPTKAIIGPDGNIKNITVGHDHAFFEILSNLLN